MSIVFNQSNNNYGSGTQNNTQNLNQIGGQKELQGLLAELEKLKLDFSQETKGEIENLTQTIKNSTEEEYSSPKFASKISAIFTTLTGLLNSSTTTLENTEKIMTVIDRIKTIIEGFW
ncbi:hypothetical protein [Streptococcus pluranimalium]|uniref:hypothetical protein n=1 Tax=Streptococcus pluranimalium TaxID=82348 RepID=UPI003BF8C6E9